MASRKKEEDKTRGVSPAVTAVTADDATTTAAAATRGAGAGGACFVGSALDVFSDGFDPAQAIYNPDFVFPDPDAPVCDNVETFIKRYEQGGVAGGSAQRPSTAGHQRHQSAKKSSDHQGSEKQQPLTRQFTAEQMPHVKPTRKQLPNVLNYMEKTKAKGGPMSVLSQCVQQRKKVKVYVRGIDRIRGHAVGFLVAFDKHWNLALVDVEETWTRKRHRKCPPIADAELVEQMEQAHITAAAAGNVNKSKLDSKKFDVKKKSSADETTSSTATTVGYSTVQVVQKFRKKELCQRHLTQLVLRGEHVACVLPIAS